MSENFKWISQKIFSYDDQNTNTAINVFLESGFSTNKTGDVYIPARVLLSFKDLTAYSLKKYQVEMYYYHISLFSDMTTKILKDGSTLKNAFDNNRVIQIGKFPNSERKSLKIGFRLIDEKYYSTISIENEDSEKTILIPFTVFLSIKNLIDQINVNYVSFNTNMVNICNMERVLDELSNMKQDNEAFKKQLISNVVDIKAEVEGIRISNIIRGDSENNNLLSENESNDRLIYDSSSSLTHVSSLISEEYTKDYEDVVFKTSDFIVEVDNSEKDEKEYNIENKEENLIQFDIPKSEDEVEIESFDAQNEFDMDFGTNLKEYVIEGLEKSEEDREKEKQDRIKRNMKNVNYSGIISSIFDNDFNKIFNWVVAWRSANEGSESSMFCPISTLMKYSLSTEDLNEYFDKNIIKSDYIVNILSKKQWVDYVKTGEYPKYKYYILDKKVPMDNTSIYKLCVDSATILVIFTYLDKFYYSKLKDDNKNVSEFKSAHAFMKNILYPFMIAIGNEYSNEEKDAVKKSIKDNFNKVINSGFLDNFKDFYNKKLGGTINIDDEVINTIISRFTDLVCEKIPEDVYFKSENFVEVMNEYNIPITEINFIDDVENAVCEYIRADEKYKVNNKRLELFKECSKVYTKNFKSEEYGNEIQGIINEIKSYDKIRKIINENDVPKELFSLKRVLDNDLELDSRSKVLKAVENLKEDPEVTYSRSLNEDECEENNSVNVDMSIEDIERLLFQ